MKTSVLSATEKLDKATIQQLTWKQKVCAIIAVRILTKALSSMAFFPDEVDFSDINADDKNVIGTTFRRLTKMEMIKETGNYRRSKSEDANGRRIFEYEVASTALANALVERLGGVRFDKQQDLPLQRKDTE